MFFRLNEDQQVSELLNEEKWEQSETRVFKFNQNDDRWLGRSPSAIPIQGYRSIVCTTVRDDCQGTDGATQLGE